MRRKRISLILIAVACLVLSGCAPAFELPAATAAQPGLAEQAAAEATAMIAQAQATAMMRRAQSEADTLLEQAEQPVEPATPAPQDQPPAQADTPAVTAVAETAVAEPAAAGTAVPESAVDESEFYVELVSVGYAADGAYIIVNFKATTRAVNDFWPGRLSVTDEASGVIYNEVPTMPVIGPLIGRPKEYGQMGYVMFVNNAPGLPPGALVTVQLSSFKQEHVPVQGP